MSVNIWTQARPHLTYMKHVKYDMKHDQERASEDRWGSLHVARNYDSDVRTLSG